MQWMPKGRSFILIAIPQGWRRGNEDLAVPTACFKNRSQWPSRKGTPIATHPGRLRCNLNENSPALLHYLRGIVAY